uniref:Uncharacterized protein n=1 Tax=Sphaerodactylus townsendi TaxID=933632 RepID=A0ACB8GEP5_9SAUR
MRCESKSNSNNVTWTFGDSPISNGSRHSITSAHSDGKSISVLKIRHILPNDSGDYSCAFPERDTSIPTMHIAKGNISVSLIQIVKSEDIVMVCNGERRELSCCVDMEMSFFDVHWKPNGAINISGTNYSTSNCTQYLLQANESQCPADKSGTTTTYTCELSTADGSRQSEHIYVKYLRKARVTLVSSANGQVSQGDQFSMRCRSDVSNYDKVSWEIQNGNPVPDINSRWFSTTKTPNGAESVLDVPRATQNWTGTYTCTFFQGPLNSSAYLAMKVIPLPLQQNIVRDPLEATIPCPGTQVLKCCVASDQMENYTVTFTVGNRPSTIQSEKRTEGNFVCYVGTLQFNSCDQTEPAFNALCEFTNQIGGRVQSLPMRLKLVPKKTITCNSSDIGVGETGAVVVKPCLGTNSTVRGNLTYRCDHIWVLGRNSCLSVPVNDLLLNAENFFIHNRYCHQQSSGRELSPNGGSQLLNSGLFILLFGILWDRKVREALVNKYSLTRWSSQSSKSSQGLSAPMLSISSPFSKAFNNLFGKAGKYQVSSTESPSLSSENTSKAYSLLT